MNLVQGLEAAFNQMGCSMMNDDFAAMLLAYVYVMGGGNEAVTQHKGLNAGICIAQQKFNLFGGEIPSKKGIDLIKKYAEELEKDMEQTVWLHQILERYDLRIHQS